MTQAAAQPAPAQAPAPAASPAPTAARAFTEDVPRLLNRLQVLAVAACVLFGVVAAIVQVLSWQANGRAADNTEQVVRVQEIQSSLLRADAIATNAFLVGGLEPADQRAEYDQALDDVLTLVADAAEAQSADRAVLARLNTEVATYATGISQARDNNRQGFPVGAAYLNGAGKDLRESTLPLVRALVDANSARAVDEMEGQHPVWLFGTGLLALLVLFWVNRLLARRFHRRLNLGLALAGILVAVLTLVSAVHAVSRGGHNDDTRAGPYQLAVDEATARTAANDAKAQESQGLINRGSGATYEELFAVQAQIVEDSASPRTLRLWLNYVDLHAQVRALDDGGDWDKAVTLATSADVTGPTAALDEVDYNAQRRASESAAQATGDFRSGGFIALLLVALTLLGALAAAGAATWGVNQRRREYS